MLKVVSVEKVREIEKAADASGLTYDMMMQNAGHAVALRVIQILANGPDARVTVLVGPGNNGGDGLVAGAVIAKESAAQVRFYLLKKRVDDDPIFKMVRDAGLFVAAAEDDRDFRVLRNMVASADVVIDALFGIGVKLPFRSDAAKVLRNVQQALHDDQQPIHQEDETINPAVPENLPLMSPYVVAVDCPSGLDCDSGALDKNAIEADETVTFIAAKHGLFEFPGAGAVGQLHVSTIGIPADLPELEAEKTVVVDAQGSTNYVGAAGLSSMAAYRSGTGLVTVGAPGPVVAMLSAQFLEPTWLLLPHDMGIVSAAAAPMIRKESEPYDALLLGPGWGRESTTRDLLLALFEGASEGQKKSTQRAIGFTSANTESTESDSTEQKLPPLVVDADGLNLLSEIEDWWKLLPAHTVITPHPGEMARLAKMETADVLEDRWHITAEKAAQWGVVLVLKGAHTLIAEPDGRMAVLPFKTDALATAGTGDVLAGLITGFLAQGLKPFEAAVVGGYVHGLAGEQAALKYGNTRSVIAGDVLASIPQALTILAPND